LRADLPTGLAEQDLSGVSAPTPPASRFSSLRHALLYGVLCGALIVVLNLVEYRYVVLTRSLEIYGALVALIFAALGIWLGLTLTGRKERVVIRETRVEVPMREPFVADPARREALGVTPRELEILELIAAGLSNKEIAERIFVSENTVKTHSSRLFEKLGARRRTQAVQLGKERGILGP
jgi:DNA-binding CsgD family transcriptional regulator